MKIAWVVLLISALTDAMLAIIGGVTGVLGVVVVNSEKAVTIQPIVFLAPVLVGIGVGLRTIQQALKSTPVMTALLQGQPVSTVTETKTVVGPPAASPGG